MKEKIYIIVSVIVLIYLFNDLEILNNNFYKDIYTIYNINDIDIIVNKNYKLSEKYIPKDLKKIDNNYSYENKFLKKQACIQFEKLSKQAKLEGFTIIAVSAYRDYDYQEKLYNNYVLEKGKWYADRCSARPGHSEHQTGLAVDIADISGDYDNFEKTKEFNWMKQNAHKYGFILRYPKEKYYITGFKYEPWHYRYVGIDIATYIHKNKLTLEEYETKKI